jgi:hypothetical protein
MDGCSAAAKRGGRIGVSGDEGEGVVRGAATALTIPVAALLSQYLAKSSVLPPIMPYGSQTLSRGRAFPVRSDALHGNAARMLRERLEVVDVRGEDSAIWFSHNHRYDVDGRAAPGSIS